MLKVLAVLIAWLFIFIGAVLAGFSFPLAWALDEMDYARNNLRALDKCAAAWLGFSGKYTVSAECGAARDGLGVYLRPVVDFLLGKGHCIDAAQREKLAP